MALTDLSIPFKLPINRQDGTTSATSRHVISPEPISAGEPSPKPDAGRCPQKPEHIMTKLLGDKNREWHDLTSRQGPLRLLDLPVDVLNLVVKEVTHTNDLVALALTHSALHELTTPQIYSRFDIVWPDSALQPEGRTGVDALTYGLATLVMAEDVFGRSPRQQPRACINCGHCDTPQKDLSPSTEPAILRKVRKRKGNYYAEFIRKFSLGNGPEEWIKEYLTNTESGKMLGTLVALAIARMRSLETFIWDMPTGILQDVWNALASLGEREDGRPCRLERVWVRWHNNSPLDKEHQYIAEATAHGIHTFWQSHSEMMRTDGQYSKDSAIDKRNKVERPTFSMLPPLKGLNVLDIDECAYLDEMSILISESRHCLKELRVGIADHSVAANWAYPWPDHDLTQVAEGKSRFSSNISALEKRLGGVLGVLTGYIFDLKKELAEANKQAEPRKSDATQAEASGEISEASISPGDQAQLPIRTASQRSGRARFIEDLPSSTQDSANDGDFSQLGCTDLINSPSRSQEPKLRLELLALERVSLSIPILSNAFDWTVLRDLTLLDCQFTAMFSNLLRRQYTPASICDHSSTPHDPDRYPLKLRKLHTNTVTPILLAFLRETLAPNTLEVLFLQQSEYHFSKVHAEKIMSVIKRHRGSLKKILVDSSERDDSDRGSARAEGWSQWQFNRSMINFITSGKMPKLRELGVAVAFKDWVSTSNDGTRSKLTHHLAALPIATPAVHHAPPRSLLDIPDKIRQQLRSRGRVKRACIPGPRHPHHPPRDRALLPCHQIKVLRDRREPCQAFGLAAR